MEIPYGRGKICFDLPPGWEADLLRPGAVSPAQDPLREVSRALDQPLGKTRLEDFGGAREAAVAVSDETRPVPHPVLLPVLLERLEKMGLAPGQITLLIASGLHPPLPPEKFPQVLPPWVLERYRVLAHDAKAPDLEFLGQTSRGTPVHVHPLFRKAGLRIAVGLIDPHQFVGYTGGVKCAAVGLAGARTIEANHSLLSDPKAVVGEIEANPVRQDLEEVGARMGVHLALNVVLDEANRIVKAFAGDPAAVEKAGSEFCRTLYEIEVSGEYDLVIASPGGYPKDLNLYQAQKGLAHATPLVRRGGVIVLAAECPDGHGEEVFYQTMIRYRSPRELIRGFLAEPFRMGVHKGFLWARSLEKARVFLVSAMEENLARRFMVQPAKSVAQALEEIGPQFPRPPRVAVMTKANSVYARVRR